MKKSLLLLVCFIGLSIGAHAQKGMSGIGGNIGAFIPFDEGLESMGGLQLKYYYNLSDNFRLQPSLMLNFSDRELMPGGSLDVHYLIGYLKTVRPYVSVGVSAASGHKHYRHDITVFGPSLGLGLNWRITHGLSMQIEAKGILNVLEAGGYANIALGLSYNF